MKERKLPGWPVGGDDVSDKYGEYEVQATCDTENAYPKIAQGLPAAEKKALQEKEARWRAQSADRKKK